MAKHISLMKTTFMLADATICRYRVIFMQKQWLSSVILQPLNTRSLLRIKGTEATPFLQGLITNDMDNFDRGSASIYAMFLNTSGRVLYDTLIHQIKSKREDFLVECDTCVVDQLKHHLNLFKVRKKVEITKPDWKIWVAFTRAGEPLIDLAKLKNRDILIFKDIRLQDLGYRIITCDESTLECLPDIFPQQSNYAYNITYEQHRYTLGIGEGIINLPQGKCFPLESNIDYLRGVSFNKGCYIGQELTARTHHTGVVRKRLMPLNFEQCLNHEEMLHDAEIKSETGQIVGKLRGYNMMVGLGLLRVEKVLACPVLIVANKYHCKTYKPKWWPV